jgi:hypothetical protein
MNIKLCTKKAEFETLQIKFKIKVKNGLRIWNEELEKVMNQKKKAYHMHLKERAGRI